MEGAGAKAGKLSRLWGITVTFAVAAFNTAVAAAVAVTCPPPPPPTTTADDDEGDAS